MTGAGILECKKALTHSEGELDSAVEWLRKNGLAKAAKMANRDASMGLVGVSVENGRAALVEINAETESVVNNALFSDLVDTVSETAARESTSEVEDLLEASCGDAKVNDEIIRVAAMMGENVVLRRAAIVNGDVMGSYVHSAAQKGSRCGLSAAAVGLKVEGGSKDDESVNLLAKQICMHVVASNPLFLDVDSVDEESKSREEAILTEKERNDGKDEKLIPRIVTGKMNKYFKENCLLEQQFILSEDKKDTIRKVLNDCAKENGFDSIDIVSYLKWECSSSQD
eukprot:g3504.t1